MSAYVLDASVAVAAVRSAEPSYRAARARLVAFLVGIDDVIVPAIFDADYFFQAPAEPYTQWPLVTFITSVTFHFYESLHHSLTLFSDFPRVPRSRRRREK